MMNIIFDSLVELMPNDWNLRKFIFA